MKFPQLISMDVFVFEMTSYPTMLLLSTVNQIFHSFISTCVFDYRHISFFAGLSEYDSSLLNSKTGKRFTEILIDSFTTDLINIANDVSIIACIPLELMQNEKCAATLSPILKTSAGGASCDIGAILRDSIVT